jgi:NAD(P)-dependent dehydrogenase (short-subunit alcohol dehydrogenase family)
VPVALVTGCSTGIGFATALRLAVDGFEVIATMRRPDRDGQRLVDAAEESGVALRLVALDVGDDESVRRAFAAVGDLDVLVNNAGIMCMGSVEETEIADWRAIFDTNVFGSVRCIRAVLPVLRRRGGGCIVNVSSAAGVAALPAVGAYAASKAALEMLSQAVAIEGGPHGIRVVLVEPGFVDTAVRGKVQPPDRESPYWGTMRNTMTWLAAQAQRASPPTVVADAVAAAVADPSTPFRVEVGQGSTELMHARSRLSDEEWIAMVCDATPAFIERYQAVTGTDLNA